jgi:predicted RNA-binding protein (virulence factor B family)
MIEIGKVHNLLVERNATSGFYLKSEDSFDEVLMPELLSPRKTEIGDRLDVFVYLDSNGRLIATSQIPYAQVGEYALLRCIETQEFGSFFDWGIEKDLLVPGNEQKISVKQYENYIVRVCLEEETDRVYGTTKLGQYIESSDFDIAVGDKIKVTAGIESDLGFRVIINKKYIGLIYSNEIFFEVEEGQTYDGVVKKIRDDGLVDAALQVQGIKNLVEAKDKIIENLKTNNGSSPLHDKSSPDAIKGTLGMSKKTFKSAIGMLYKDKKILINKDGIILIQEDTQI